MDHTFVVKQQGGQRLLHHKTYAVLPVGIKDAGFAAFDAAATHQQNDDKINPITVRALGRGSAHTAGGVNAKLVGLDEPLFHRLDIGKQLAERCQQANPQGIVGDAGLNRFEPALKTAVQRVVVNRLPVRPMRYRLQSMCDQVLRKTSVTPVSIMTAIA